MSFLIHQQQDLNSDIRRGVKILEKNCRLIILQAEFRSTEVPSDNVRGIEENSIQNSFEL
jgi:hypothetical protein